MSNFFKNFFKKKPEQVKYEDDSVKVTGNTNKAMYDVVIKEKFGKGTTTLKEIKAERFIDLDDHVVYLKNKKENFLELFPQDENDFEQLDKKEIEANLRKARTLYKKELEHDTEAINEKNVLFDIMKYEAKLRALKYDRDADYMTIGVNGMKRFYFMRQGSTFYPFKWDTDNKTIYVANENKKKKAGIARNNKAIKYNKFKNTIEGSIMLIMILNILFGLGNGIIAYKFFSKFDESEIVKAQNFCIEKGAEWTAITERNAKATETILNNIKGRFDGRNIIMDTFIPTEINLTS